MSEQLIEKYGNQLNEEKWTRAAINNYTIKNFEDLDILIEQFYDHHIQPEILNLTDDYLNKNKNSIIALYVSTAFQVKEGRIENNNPYNLIKIFSDNLKWNIVEYICKKTSGVIKDKVIVRSLIEALNNLGKKEEVYQYWEELIKVDYEEANIVLKLAEKKEAEGQREEAISYYKKAINRNIHNRNFSQIEEIWKKLLSFDEVGCDFFLSLEKKIFKVFSIDKVVELLFIVYEHFKELKEWSTCIRILKIILDYDSRNEYARTEIVFVYRNKYAGHSQLEEYIRKSNLDGLWRTSSEAISSFEKHIAIDVGNFVYHRDWGIGLIKSVEKDDFIIDFQRSRDHRMSLKLAISSLQVLPKNHIWILKLKNMNKLKEMVIHDPLWAMKVIIKSYHNRVKLKDIKAELVPDVITPGKWNNWWSKAKESMKNDPTFGTVDENSDIYILRDRPISIEERTSNAFKASKDFVQRFNIAYQYFLQENEPDSDLLDDMVNYFATHVKSTEVVNEQTIMSFLLLKQFQKKFNFLNIILPDFKNFIDNVDDPLDIYEKITLQDLKNDFLYYIKVSDPNWQNTYIRFFFLYPGNFIYQELANSDKKYIDLLIKDLIVAYKEYREAFFWIVSKILTSEEKAKTFGVNYDNILFSLLHLIELTGKDVSIKKETTKNKKLANQIKDYLFKNNLLEDYIVRSSKTFSKRLYVITTELISLDGEYKLRIKEKISEIYPEIDTENQALAYDESSKESIIDKLLTTKKSFEEKQKELQHINEVEIPENSLEIGEAMEKGDLRENAEFKAAKEKQEFLRNKLTKLHNDLTRVVIIGKEDIKADTVTFGTVVELMDKLDSDKVITYVVLGPWESNTENNVISYQSPLGKKLLDKKVNDDVKFLLNDKEYHYVVKSVSVYDFE